MAKKKSGKRTTFMFPALHQQIAKAVSDDNISTWFHKNDSDEGSNNEYSTHVMGRFKCNNNACSTEGWSSKMVVLRAAPRYRSLIVEALLD